MSEKKAILSPLPGVFYRKPSPEQAEYVQEGEVVKAGDVVGIIEVMKNFYEVTSEEDGIIEKFLIDNESLVDAGQQIAVFKQGEGNEG